MSSQPFFGPYNVRKTAGREPLGLPCGQILPSAEYADDFFRIDGLSEEQTFAPGVYRFNGKIFLSLRMTEKEKMLSGEFYSAVDAQLLSELGATRDVIHRYNTLLPSDTEARLAILKDLLGHIGDDKIIINPPFYCDYGKQIRVGRRFFANFNFTVLDEAPVTIGDDCFIGPGVSIYTACHSTDPVERNNRREWAEAVTIGDNVWIGGSVTILPGVSIGSNTTIGAGSVVTKDIPDNVVAAGNPCRVIRKIG